ncbi:MAG TPA: L,D-transpeptidase [Solirubrobacterales bacterium]|nr:L,D-transpeptidase [Solirubrobacterales bacterium]
MGRKTILIIATAAVLVAALVVAGAYLYDRSQEGKIAAGVTIDGIDVGGMDAEEAEAKLRRELLRPLEQPLRATYRARRWSLPAARLKVRADVEGAVARAVEVSREGDLPTRIGRYLGGEELQAMEEEPTWYVPESDWAGDLAGQVIPPGPDNPIKARWMAIFEGAGIHGTEETASLGTAASHGCVRMSIPDVEELYDQVEVGTPIFIG